MESLTNRVTCNFCQFVFDANVEEKELADRSVVVTFVCPRCGAVYDIAHITVYGLKLRDKLTRMREGAGSGQSYIESFQRTEARFQKEVTKL